MLTRVGSHPEDKDSGGKPWIGNQASGIPFQRSLHHDSLLLAVYLGKQHLAPSSGARLTNNALLQTPEPQSGLFSVQKREDKAARGPSATATLRVLVKKKRNLHPSGDISLL